MSISNHGMAMSFTWTILAYIQLASHRYLKEFSWHTYVHRTNGALIFILTIYNTATKISTIQYYDTLYFHIIYGGLLVILIIFLVIFGLMADLQLMYNKWDYRPAKMLKNLHVYLGWTLVFACQYQIVLGFITYSTMGADQLTRLQYVITCVYLAFVMVVEICFQMYKHKPFAIPTPTEEISMEEFDRRLQNGDQLVILDDLVVDVKSLVYRHPGSAFAISHTVGRDISKFFYGGYSLEIIEGQQPHKHSRIAKDIVTKLTVARLNQKNQKFEATVVEVEQINSDSKTFILQDKGIIDKLSKCRLQIFYPGIDSFGQYYLLNCDKMQRKIGRQYTICNLMRKQVYDDYIRVIRLILEKKPYVFKEETFDTSNCRNFCVTIKNYPRFRGLSWFIHQQKPLSSIPFGVKGPMGKGLCLQPNSTHIAFGAGTGVLPFLDLVAYLFRLNIDQLHPGEQGINLGPEFKFTFYVSFPCREESIALEFLEGVYSISKKLKKNNFKLVLRLSNETRVKWDFDFIEKAMLDEQSLKKVYGCGPPIMTEILDKTFDLISEDLDLPKDMFDIL